MPQIARLTVGRDTRGVSPDWARFGLLTNLAWVAYLWHREMWVASIAPALAVVSYGITVVTIARLDRISRSSSASLLFGGVLALIAWAGGVTTLGLALTVTPLIQMAPELAAIYRERHPVGVSPATWSIAATEAVLWGIYGWGVGDPALVGFGFFTATASLLILGRWVVTQPRRVVVRSAPGFG